MALQWSTVQMLQGKNLFKAGGSVLDIGSSNIYGAETEAIASFVAAFKTLDDAKLSNFATDIAARSQAVIDGQQQNKAFLGEVLTTAGMRYDSVDIADGYRTKLIDLNSGSVPSAFAAAFDLVMNVGTSEHILSQANCFKFVHDATRVGGLMFHQLPASGFTNHGYFCYTPRLFCDLAGYNKYEVVDLWFDGPSAHENLYAAVRSYSGTHPALQTTLARIVENARDKQIEQTMIPDMSINVILRRTTSERFLGTLETSTSVGPVAASVFNAYSGGIASRVLRRTRQLAGQTRVGKSARRLIGD